MSETGPRSDFQNQQLYIPAAKRKDENAVADIIYLPFQNKERFYMLLPFDSAENWKEELTVLKELRDSRCHKTASEESKVLQTLPEEDRLGAIVSHFACRYLFIFHDKVTEPRWREVCKSFDFKPHDICCLVVDLMEKHPEEMNSGYFDVPKPASKFGSKEGKKLHKLVLGHIFGAQVDPGYLTKRETYRRYPELKQYCPGKSLAGIVPSRSEIVEHLKHALYLHYEDQYFIEEWINPGDKKTDDQIKLAMALELSIWRARVSEKDEAQMTSRP